MIDAHHHLWQIGQHGCAWPGVDLTAIYRDFLLPDFLSVAQSCGITGSILVQSQANDQDTDYLLQVAAASDFIKAVVGWVDFESPDVLVRIEQLETNKKLRGLRPMLQNMADDKWILQPRFASAFAAMQAKELCLDALVFTRHLPGLRIFAERYPQLHMVIDHGAKPPIAAADGRQYKQWCRNTAALAELPQVYCKISGLLTEAGSTQGADELLPYVEHLYRQFGPRRLLWGSDWPVLALSFNSRYRGYDAWLTLAKHVLAMAGATEMNAIFCENAARIYRFNNG